MPDEAALLDAFARQVEWCRVPSPFTSRLLERSAMWLRGDARARAAFAAVADDPLAAAVSLRWAGALHHLALRGLAPWAGLWPPAGAAPDAAALDSAFDAAIAQAWNEQGASVRGALARPPQTNEVQRSAALLPGLLHVAQRTGLPVVLLEIGASAGLNLWCDRYRHEHGAWQWGDPQSPLTLRAAWTGPVPAAARAALRIQRRAACDPLPVDLSLADEGLRLASFIWPDQAERLARLNAARHAAEHWLAAEGVAVEALSAAAFLRRELQAPQPGAVTVVMHSVVWQYIAPAEQAAITAAMAAAAAKATATAPLAWLRLEPPAPDMGVRLSCQLWDGGAHRGQEQLLARAHPHVARIEWLPEAAT